LFANVPANLRLESKTYKTIFPFNLFASTGEVWQLLGVHGTFDLEAGKKMLELVAKYNPEHSFRLVLVQFSQKTREIESVNISK